MGELNMASAWCILRTSGRHTMSLAETLAKDGFDVWTPIETRKVWISSANVKREVRQAIMPSYVFARAEHLVDLLQLAAMPVKPRRGQGCREAAHAGFSVLHAFGRIPLVADHHLAELRKLEAKRTPVKRAAYSFPHNASAKVSKGVFGGLVGVVIRSTPDATVLSFAGSFPVTIPTSLLTLDGVSNTVSALKAA
jgi:hypothetical protein